MKTGVPLTEGVEILSADFTAPSEAHVGLSAYDFSIQM